MQITRGAGTSTMSDARAAKAAKAAAGFQAQQGCTTATVNRFGHLQPFIIASRQPRPTGIALCKSGGCYQSCCLSGSPLASARAVALLRLPCLPKGGWWLFSPQGSPIRSAILLLVRRQQASALYSNASILFFNSIAVQPGWLCNQPGGICLQTAFTPHTHAWYHGAVETCTQPSPVGLGMMMWLLH